MRRGRMTTEEEEPQLDSIYGSQKETSKPSDSDKENKKPKGQEKGSKEEKNSSRQNYEVRLILN